MKKMTMALLVVLMFAFSAVPALAQTYPTLNFEVRDGNTYSGIFKTSTLSDKEKAFLREWVKSDKNILVVWSQSPNSVANYSHRFSFAIVQDETILNSSPFVFVEYYSSYPSVYGIKSVRPESDKAINSLSCEMVSFDYMKTKGPYVFSTSYLSPDDYPLSSFYPVGGTFFKRDDVQFVNCGPKHFMEYTGDLILRANAGILDGYNVTKGQMASSEHTLTIEYQYEDGSQASSPHTETLSAGTTYNVTSPEISGYTANIPIVTGSMPNDDLTITVTYTKTVVPHQLTIVYQYENGTPVRANHTELINAGEKYTVASPSIIGYMPDQTAVTGLMPDNDLEIVVTYKANTHQLLIEYQYADSSPASPPYTATLKYNEAYRVESPLIPGFAPDQKIVSGKMPDEDVSVTVTYTVPSYVLTIQYLYADGTTAKPTHTETLQLGASYNIPTPPIEGYTPDRDAVYGTMPERDMTYTVRYTKNGEPPPDEYTLTVNYLYEDGTIASPPYMRTYQTGASYWVRSPKIEGYTADQESVTGHIENDNVSHTVIYTKDDVPPVVTAHTLTIRYVFQDGLTAYASHIASVNEGASYDVPSPALSGYTPDKPSVAGTMPGNDLTVVVTYAKNETPVDPPKPPSWDDPFHIGDLSGFDDPFRIGDISGYADPFQIGGFGEYDDPFYIGGLGGYDDPFHIGESPQFDDPFSYRFNLFTGAIGQQDYDSGNSIAETPYSGLPEDFLGFSPHVIETVGRNLRSNIGSIFSVAIYAFILVISVYLIITVVSSLGK